MADIEIREGASQALIEAYSCAKSEPEFALASRREAAAIFDATPWPTRTDEAWRRTDLSDLLLDDFVPGEEWGSSDIQRPKVSPALRELLTTDSQAGASLVEIDGVTAELRVSNELRSQGVIVCSLETALIEHPDLIRAKFGAAPYDLADKKFTALARAFWTGGKFVFVPKNTHAKLAIELHTSVVNARTVFPGLLIIAEPNSKVEILDEFVSAGGSAAVLSSGTADLHLGEGADVRYVLLNRWGQNVNHFHHQRTQLGKDSHLKTLTIALGSRLTKATIEAVLDNPGAVSDMLGLVFGTGKQHFDHHTSQDHRTGHTLSDLMFKTALDDSAHSVYSGMIRIEKGAQQANAYQANNNLLLSKGAQADTIPNLEIEANEVRCTHGATVAPVESEYVFYLMSRGIPETDAKRLIVEGWFEQVLDRADIENLRDLMSEKIGAKIKAQVK